MAIYKANMSENASAYNVRMPDNALGYMVWLPDSAEPTESIEVDMTFAPAGASWTVTNSLLSVVASGSVSMPATQFGYESYTITWHDTSFPYEPPAPEGPIVLSAGNPITFELTDEPPASGLNPGDIQVTFSASDAANIQHVSWSLHGPDSATILASGTGDTPTPLTANPDGDYYVTWGWTQDHWTPTGWDTNTHPTGAGPNGPWTSATQTLSANGIEFDGDYQARAMPTRAQSAFSLDVPPGAYWRGAFDLSSPMHAYSGWRYGSGVKPPLDASFWPTSIPGGPVHALCAMPPSGTDAVQTYWVFWNGEGTINISGGNGGAGLTGYTCVLGTGQAGTSFTFGPHFGLEESGNSWCTINITATGSGGNYLKDIEIVHEDYCDGGADKSFRDVSEGGNYCTDYFYHHYAHTGAIRMLEQIDQVYDPQPNGEEGNGWTSNAFGSGVDGFELDFEGQGRQWGSQANIDGSTVGAAWQVYIDQANAAGKDLWINTPTFSNDTLCDLIFSAIEAPYVAGGGGGLRDGLKVLLEYSNETWNGIFTGLDYGSFWGAWHAGLATDQYNRPFSGMSIGQKLSPTTGFEDSIPGPYQAGRRYHTYRLWQLANLYKANSNYLARSHPSFGERVVIVSAGHRANVWLEYWQFWVNGTFNGTVVSFDGVNPITDTVDAYACTNYSNIGTWGDWPPADFDAYADTYFDHWVSEITTTQRTRLLENTTFATAIGLPLWAYESGSGLSPYGDPQGEWSTYIQNHPRMYEVYSTLNQQWKSDGGEFCSHYKGPQYWKKPAEPFYWGIKSGSVQDDDKAYRYMAQVDFACNNHKWW